MREPLSQVKTVCADRARTEQLLPPRSTQKERGRPPRCMPTQTPSQTTKPRRAIGTGPPAAAGRQAVAAAPSPPARQARGGPGVASAGTAAPGLHGAVGQEKIASAESATPGDNSLLSPEGKRAWHGPAGMCESAEAMCALSTRRSESQGVGDDVEQARAA